MWEWLAGSFGGRKDYEDAVHKINKNLPRKKHSSVFISVIIWFFIAVIVYFMYQRYDCYKQTNSYMACSYFGNDVEQVERVKEKGMF